MTRDEAVQQIRNTAGKIFACEFTKRTTGECRVMICRLHVRSHLRGGSPAYNAAEKNLITVFDMSKNDYRCIPIEGLTRVRVDGEWQAIDLVQGELFPPTPYDR